MNFSGCLDWNGRSSWVEGFIEQMDARLNSFDRMSIRLDNPIVGAGFKPARCSLNLHSDSRMMMQAGPTLTKVSSSPPSCRESPGPCRGVPYGRTRELILRLHDLDVITARVFEDRQHHVLIFGRFHRKRDAERLETLKLGVNILNAERCRGDALFE